MVAVPVPTLTLAKRSTRVVLEFTTTSKTPVPEPDPPSTTVAQLWLLKAVHGQPLGAITLYVSVCWKLEISLAAGETV